MIVFCICIGRWIICTLNLGLLSAYKKVWHNIFAWLLQCFEGSRDSVKTCLKRDWKCRSDDHDRFLENELSNIKFLAVYFRELLHNIRSLFYDKFSIFVLYEII